LKDLNKRGIGNLMDNRFSNITTVCQAYNITHSVMRCHMTVQLVYTYVSITKNIRY